MTKTYEYIEVDGMTMLAHKRVNWRELGVAAGLGLMLVMLLISVLFQQQKDEAYGRFLNECTGHGVQYAECYRNEVPPTPRQ